MSGKYKKPDYLSHYLVLKDLIDGIDPRQFNDVTTYMTARIENIKTELKDKGLVFDEEATAEGKYAPYKPYVLIHNKENLELADSLLSEYGTDKVLSFLDGIVWRNTQVA